MNSFVMLLNNLLYIHSGQSCTEMSIFLVQKQAARGRMNFILQVCSICCVHKFIYIAKRVVMYILASPVQISNSYVQNISRCVFLVLSIDSFVLSSCKHYKWFCTIINLSGTDYNTLCDTKGVSCGDVFHVFVLSIVELLCRSFFIWYDGVEAGVKTRTFHAK